MVLDVTAKTDTGTVVTVARRVFRQIGLDLAGRQQMGSWEIKEIVDLSLQPGKSVREKYVAELPAGTKSAEVEATLTMNPSAKHGFVVERVVRGIVVPQ